MMNREALSVCKAFLLGASEEMQGSLFALLPSDEQLEMQQMAGSTAFEIEHLKWDLLDHLHFSWLAPYLRTLCPSDIRLFLSVLSSPQVNGLEKALGIQNHLPKPSSIAKTALRKILLEKVRQNQQLIPPAFLPDHPLNQLLALTPFKMEHLIRLLGLHDLSFEMRQIIATKKLKAIFAALPKKEGEFLNTLLLHKEPLVFKRLFLQDWDGSKEGMAKLIVERGLHRLGHALYGCDESLIWYLTRMLDLHFGTLLLKYKEKPTHERAETILVKQVEQALQSLKTGEEA